MLQGERGAETTAARECCKGSAKQTDGLEGECACLAGLCMQRDWAGSKNVTGKLQSGRIGGAYCGVVRWMASLVAADRMREGGGWADVKRTAKS